MHKYLIEIQLYFKGKQTFEVYGDCKEGALAAAYRKAASTYGHDEYIFSSIKVIKKLKDN